jgi:hypothetical protein
MTASTRVHRSTAYVRAIAERGRAWKPDPITPQFRFIMRMAYACHQNGIAYDVQWAKHGDAAMGATLTASGAIPTPKPLPRAPRLRLVPAWKPAIWDAVYRLDAYHDANLKRRCPGFVIAHSCGLAYHAFRIGPGIRPYTQFQACHGCAVARGILPRGLDSIRGSARS